MAANLRDMMQSKKTSSKKARVSHPLAKYDNLDRLMCVICEKVLKDDSLWNPHLQSKRHKETVLLVKNKNVTQQSNGKTLGKEKGTSSSSKGSSQLPMKDKGDRKCDKPKMPDVSAAAIRSKLQSGSNGANSNSSEKKVENSTKPRSILKTNSISAQQQAINEKIKKATEVASQQTQNTESNSSLNKIGKEDAIVNNAKRKLDSSLPSDFFDKSEQNDEVSDGIAIKKTKKDEVVVPQDNNASSIPEGFFDDPKKDAAARNVEYKDPKEKEWLDFQKVIQEETKVSEALQEEEEEESEMLKDLSELNKMKACLSKVENMKKLLSKEKETKQELMDEKPDFDDLESDEEIDLFDWRAKMA